MESTGSDSYRHLIYFLSKKYLLEHFPWRQHFRLVQLLDSFSKENKELSLELGKGGWSAILHGLTHQLLWFSRGFFLVVCFFPFVIPLLCYIQVITWLTPCLKCFLVKTKSRQYLFYSSKSKSHFTSSNTFCILLKTGEKSPPSCPIAWTEPQMFVLPQSIHLSSAQVPMPRVTICSPPPHFSSLSLPVINFQSQFLVDLDWFI